MNFTQTLRGLLRRWYISIPGLILAAAVAAAAWTVVPPSYQRTATELLIPGKENMPAGSNPLLFLGGLSYAADVLVTAVGAENVAGEMEKQTPGTQIDVQRSASSSGPMLVTTVTARTDALARDILARMVDRTAAVLSDLQTSQRIATDNRITVVPVAVDTTSTVQQRNRLVATSASGLGVAALALLTAGLVDGVSAQRRRRPQDADDDESQDEDEDADGDGDGDVDERADEDAPAEARERVVADDGYARDDLDEEFRMTRLSADTAIAGQTRSAR